MPIVKGVLGMSSGKRFSPVILSTLERWLKIDHIRLGDCFAVVCTVDINHFIWGSFIILKGGGVVLLIEQCEWSLTIIICALCLAASTDVTVK